jgi:hypothetical protein
VLSRSNSIAFAENGLDGGAVFIMLDQWYKAAHETEFGDSVAVKVSQQRPNSLF